MDLNEAVDWATHSDIFMAREFPDETQDCCIALFAGVTQLRAQLASAERISKGRANQRDDVLIENSKLRAELAEKETQINRNEDYIVDLESQVDRAVRRSQYWKKEHAAANAEALQLREALIRVRDCYHADGDGTPPKLGRPSIKNAWNNADKALNSTPETAKVQAVLEAALNYYDEYNEHMMTPEQDDGTHQVEIIFVKAVRAWKDE